jgi:hypothetical protein
MTARELAMDFLRYYVARGDSYHGLTDSGRMFGDDLNLIQIGGAVRRSGRWREYTHDQIIVTRCNGQDCLRVYPVREIVRAIENEHRVSQLTLW